MEINKFFVKQLIMIGTRDRYEDVGVRDYTTHLTPGTANAIKNAMSKNGRVRNIPISPIEISKTAPNVIALNPIPNNVAVIPNGWGTKRFMFLMEVIEDISPYSSISHYFSGYTDFYDISIGGHIDENMNFHINNVIQVSRNIDPITGQVFVTPNLNLNIVRDHRVENGLDIYNMPNKHKLIRPKDILDDLFILDLGKDPRVSSYINHSDILASSDVSRVSNSNPLIYFTNTVNSFIRAKNTSTNYDQVSEILNNASATIDDGNILNNNFAEAVSRITGEPKTSRFTLNILTRLDPSLSSSSQNRIHVFKDGPSFNVNPQAPSFIDTEVTAPTVQPLGENVLAQTIFNAITSIMGECMVTALSCSCTNSSGSDEIIVTSCRSFIEGIDTMFQIHKVEDKVKSLLLPMIGDGNFVPYDVFIDSDLMGDTNLSISTSFQPLIQYRFPTFASGLFSPVMSTTERKELVTEDFNNILDLTYDNNGLTTF